MFLSVTLPGLSPRRWCDFPHGIFGGRRVSLHLSRPAAELPGLAGTIGYNNCSRCSVLLENETMPWTCLPRGAFLTASRHKSCFSAASDKTRTIAHEVRVDFRKLAGSTVGDKLCNCPSIIESLVHSNIKMMTTQRRTAYGGTKNEVNSSKITK